MRVISFKVFGIELARIEIAGEAADQSMVEMIAALIAEEDEEGQPVPLPAPRVGERLIWNGEDATLY